MYQVEGARRGREEPSFLVGQAASVPYRVQIAAELTVRRFVQPQCPSLVSICGQCPRPQFSAEACTNATAPSPRLRLAEPVVILLGCVFSAKAGPLRHQAAGDTLPP